jgi:hypothetical protein
MFNIVTSDWFMVLARKLLYVLVAYTFLETFVFKTVVEVVISFAV